jgi:hypothetical protein
LSNFVQTPPVDNYSIMLNWMCPASDLIGQKG